MYGGVVQHAGNSPGFFRFTAVRYRAVALRARRMYTWKKRTTRVSDFLDYPSFSFLLSVDVWYLDSTVSKQVYRTKRPSTSSSPSKQLLLLYYYCRVLHSCCLSCVENDNVLILKMFTSYYNTSQCRAVVRGPSTSSLRSTGLMCQVWSRPPRNTPTHV